MVDLVGLSKYLNAIVDLTFSDGHVVRAKLITVDLDRPQEIIYDVVEVVERGPEKLAKVKPGTVASADPALLVSFRPV
jgi:hypothetical protein